MHKDTMSELVASELGASRILTTPARGSRSGELRPPVLALRAPNELVQRWKKHSRYAMSVAVIEREGITYFFFGMLIGGFFQMFLVNPGEGGLLEYLEHAQTQNEARVLLIADEASCVRSVQCVLPRGNLEAALEVARRKPAYAPQAYARVLRGLLAGRTDEELLELLFSQKELMDLLGMEPPAANAGLLH